MDRILNRGKLDTYWLIKIIESEDPKITPPKYIWNDCWKELSLSLVIFDSIILIE